MRGNQAAALRALGERLREVGFGAQGLRDLLGVRFPDDVGLLNCAPMLERLRAQRSPAAALARLFYLEAAESCRSLRGALSPDQQAELSRAGLLSRRAGRVTARLRIDAVDDIYLLADRRFRPLDAGALRLPGGEMVYPPGADSVILGEIVAAREGDRVLDLCTGTGIQALSIARRAGPVSAIDVGPRAVAVAQANGVLNGIATVTTCLGDLYDPVRGERFDLVVANPPFVASPQRGPAYHAGGPRGDRVLGRLVNGLAEHLEPGGRAFVISHLALRRGEGVAAAMRGKLRRFPGRVLVLVLETGSRVDLAAAQAVFALDGGFAAYAAEIQRWVKALRRQSIEQIALVLVVAERRGKASLEVVEAAERTLRLPLSRPPREHVTSWLGQGP